MQLTHLIYAQTMWILKKRQKVLKSLDDYTSCKWFFKCDPLLEQLETAPDTRYTAIYWPDMVFMVSMNTELQKVCDFTFTWQESNTIYCLISGQDQLPGSVPYIVNNPEAPWLCHHPGFMLKNFTDHILLVWSGDQKTVGTLSALVRQVTGR